MSIISQLSKIKHGYKGQFGIRITDEDEHELHKFICPCCSSLVPQSILTIVEAKPSTDKEEFFRIFFDYFVFAVDRSGMPYTRTQKHTHHWGDDAAIYRTNPYYHATPIYVDCTGISNRSSFYALLIKIITTTFVIDLSQINGLQKIIKLYFPVHTNASVDDIKKYFQLDYISMIFCLIKQHTEAPVIFVFDNIDQIPGDHKNVVINDIIELVGTLNRVVGKCDLKIVLAWLQATRNSFVSKVKLTQNQYGLLQNTICIN